VFHPATHSQKTKGAGHVAIPRETKGDDAGPYTNPSSTCKNKPRRRGAIQSILDGTTTTTEHTRGMVGPLHTPTQNKCPRTYSLLHRSHTPRIHQRPTMRTYQLEIYDAPMPKPCLSPVFPSGPLNLNPDGSTITYKKSHLGPNAMNWKQADAEEM
jgi:hypothetical protein